MWNTPRQYPRFQNDSAVRLSAQDSNQKFDGFCTDVAVGGVGVRVAAEFGIGDVVQVEFPGTPQPSLHARIVYRNGSEYGLSFIDAI